MNHFVWIAVATSQCAALLSAALFVDRFLHRKSAALRHGAFISFLTLSLLCPLVTACLPPLRVLPHGQQELATARIQSEGTLQSDSYPIAPEHAEPTRVKQRGSLSVGEASLREVAKSYSNWGFNAAGSLVVWIWLTGSCVLVIRIIISWISLQYICFCGERNTDLDDLGERSPAAAGVRILISDLVNTPLSFGLVAPCVVLPRSLLTSEMDREKLEGIVLHELAHINRYDSIWQWVTLLSQSLHWFNPLVWIVARKAGIQREIACDDHVVESGISPRKYVQVLVESMGTPHTPTDPCLALSLSSKSDMETRIRSILDGSKSRGRTSRGLLALGAVIFGTFLVGISILRADEPHAGIDDAIAMLRRVDDAIVTASVECKSSFKFDFYGPDGLRPKPGLIEDDATGLRSNQNTKWLYRNDGSWRFKGETSGTTEVANGPSIRGHSTMISVFNGTHQRGKHVVINSKNADALYNIEEIFGDSLVTINQDRPPKFLSCYLEKPIADLIEKGSQIVNTDEKHDGSPMVIVSTEAEVWRPGYHWYHKFWIDVKRGVVVRCQTFSRKGADRPWGLHIQRDCEGYRLHRSSGLWLPSTSKTLKWTVNEKGQDKLYSESHNSFVKWKINPDIDDEMFSIEVSLLPTSDK